MHIKQALMFHNILINNIPYVIVTGPEKTTQSRKIYAYSLDMQQYY